MKSSLSLFLKRSIQQNTTDKKLSCCLGDLHPYKYSFDRIGGMEPHWPLVLQEGNKVVKHVYLKVLTIKPPKEYKYEHFPPNLNSSHASQREHTHRSEKVRHKTFCLKWENNFTSLST